MELSNQQLIAEAIETNHSGVGQDRTLDRYRSHLVHYDQYLASVFGVSFYTARRKHVRMFMGHLAKPGGPKPHDARRNCAWCQTRNFPDGRSGPGWSPSLRKSYLAAIKFLYLHFLVEEDLPDLNPAALEQAPKVPIKLGYTPSSEDIKKLLTHPGTPRGRLLAHWLFYAPSRRQTFVDARWRDIDLDQGTWRVMGKGQKFDIFDLAPPLIRVLRLYRSWQLSEAARNEAIRDALADPETTYVLLTRTGRQTSPQTIDKITKWHPSEPASAYANHRAAKTPSTARPPESRPTPTAGPGPRSRSTRRRCPSTLSLRS